MASEQLPLVSDSLVHCIEIDSHHSLFGCPCCCVGDTAHFIRPQFYPHALSEVVSQSDLYSLLDQCDKKFHDTGFPCWPNAFIIPLTLVCFPCWVCHWSYTKNKRKADMDTLVKEWNDKHTEEGVYLEWNSIYMMTSGDMETMVGQINEKQAQLGLPGLNVKVNQTTRDAYHAKMGRKN